VGEVLFELLWVEFDEVGDGVADDEEGRGGGGLEVAEAGLAHDADAGEGLLAVGEEHLRALEPGEDRWDLAFGEGFAVVELDGAGLSRGESEQAGAEVEIVAEESGGEGDEQRGDAVRPDRPVPGQAGD